MLTATREERQLNPTAAERRLGLVLRWLAFLFLVTAAATTLGPFAWTGADDLFREPPFVVATVAVVTSLAMAMIFAAGDPRGRSDLVAAVLLGLGTWIAAGASMALLADTAASVELWQSNVQIDSVLWLICAALGLTVLVLGVLWLQARGTTGADDPGQRFVVGPADELTRREIRLRITLFLLAAFFAAAADGSDPMQHRSSLDQTKQTHYERPDEAVTLVELVRMTPMGPRTSEGKPTAHC